MVGSSCASEEAVRNKGLVVLVLSCVLAVVTMLLIYVSCHNREVRLRNEAAAQQQNLEVVYDATWKIIQQKAGVSSQYADDFKNIYPELIEGRYGDVRGGAIMSWITEHNPEFDTSLYLDLMGSIEAERTKFAREQKRLLDIKREHDDLRQTFPGSIFVGGRPEIEVMLVASTKTQDVFEAGKEDEIGLFGPDKSSK